VGHEVEVGELKDVGMFIWGKWSQQLTLKEALTVSPIGSEGDDGCFVIRRSMWQPRMLLCC
jgi:hypothetical protein